MLSCALVAFNDEALKDRHDMCHVTHVTQVTQVTHAHCKLAHIHPLRVAACTYCTFTQCSHSYMLAHADFSQQSAAKMPCVFAAEPNVT